MPEPTLFDPPPLAARRSDPDTSHAAANKARRRTALAVAIVRSVMHDGLPRTDEQIHDVALSRHHDISEDVVRHARLALKRNGELHDTGHRAPTRRGGTAILWQCGE